MPANNCPGRNSVEPMRAGYYAMVKEVEDNNYTGKWNRVWIEHRMTTQCQAAKERYAECEGCKWMEAE